MNIELKKISNKTGKPGKTFKEFSFTGLNTGAGLFFPGSDIAKAAEKVKNYIYSEYMKKYGLVSVNYEYDMVSKEFLFYVNPAIRIYEPATIKGTIKE